jgi:ABC-2 type transport system permease protein
MKTFAVYKKEVVSLFVSPIAYVSIALFLFLLSYLVTFDLNTGDMRDVFSGMSILMIFFIPMATMRVLSEEMSRGTHELLLTSPLSLASIVTGKFLAVMTLVLALFLCTAQYAVLIAVYGKPDWTLIATGYLGLLLLCAQFVAIGVFASSLTSNQFIAAVVTFVGLLFFIAVDVLSYVFAPGVLADVFEHLAVFTHFQDFDSGLLNLSHFIYYIGMIILFLFLAVRKLETKRW